MTYSDIKGESCRCWWFSGETLSVWAGEFRVNLSLFKIRIVGCEYHDNRTRYPVDFYGQVRGSIQSLVNRRRRLSVSVGQWGDT